MARCVAAMRARVARPRHRQVPHRHRRPGQRGRPGAVHRRGRRRRLPHLHRARAQGLARGAVAQGEPRGAAARLRPRLAAEGGPSRARDRHQRRHRLARRGRGAPGPRRRRGAGPRRLSEPLSAGRGRRPPVRGRGGRPRRAAPCSEQLIPYAERHVRHGGRLNNVTRHILGLYHGRPRARAFRRHLSERAPREGAGVEVLRGGDRALPKATQQRPWRLRSKLAARSRVARHASSGRPRLR